MRAVALALLLVVAVAPAAAAPRAAPRPGAVAPNASPRVARALATRYAPLLHLQSQERFGLMRVEDFLAHARLVWSRPGTDPVLAAEGTVQAARLGARCARAPGGCYRHGGVAANTFSRPSALDDPGFALELDPAWRAGSPGGAPLLYDVAVGTRGLAITYWFFYGYDQPPLDLGPGVSPAVEESLSALLAHEGDWERVVVLLSLDLRPRGVRYHQHDTSRFVPWARVARAAGAHPVVWVAQGTHASYAKPGTTRLCIGPTDCLLDRRDAGGALVRGWRAGLVPVRTQPWYGFGGAWGRVGGLSATTGPLGPSRWKR